MSDDATLPQVWRMRQWLMHEYTDHLQWQCRCRDAEQCYHLMNCQIQQLSHWALIDIELQRRANEWQQFDRESEGV